MRSTVESRYLLATRSQEKAREIRDIIARVTQVELVTLEQIGIAAAAAEDELESFPTFLENAHAKAAYFRQLSGLATIADDSGICVHALDGRPGVLSKRFAADSGFRGGALDHANNARLLQALQHVPPPQRAAHYACAAVVHRRDGTRFGALGTCTGAILDTPRGHNGFGYDPLFLDVETGLSFGETDPRLKNRKSHRARAFRALAIQL